MPEQATMVAPPRAGAFFDPEREKILGFLQILQTKTEDLSDLSRWSRGGAMGRPGRSRYADFMRCRDVAAECWAFSIVIERRIDLYHGPERDTLQAQFDRLTVAIWSVLLETSLRFLEALAGEDHLPLGSREIFVREIKTLYDSRKFLEDPRYDALIDAATHRRQDQATRILEAIIERAPALLDFSAA
ncbi:hypothetical protein [Novispirillum itersonii]|uniref:hypothetical protein n=1 Tax=Novispirillum itersonii TaxID=189 RepID=UPI0003718173|nr:hypothetical protein [Novispirillum itersonii]